MGGCTLILPFSGKHSSRHGHSFIGLKCKRWSLELLEWLEIKEEEKNPRYERAHMKDLPNPYNLLSNTSVVCAGEMPEVSMGSIS